jgi:outer membrane protein assembly factor BamB
MKPISKLFASRAAAAALLAPLAAAQNWSNHGGNAARNGQSAVNGPSQPSVAWSAPNAVVISWAPFIGDGAVFTVRETGFPQSGGAANDAIVCYDLATGAVRWSTTLAFNGNTSQQWIASIAGVNGGRVYATRSQNGSPQPITALDANTGAFLWSSAATQTAFAYDGAVFEPSGDLVIGDFNSLKRIRASDGATVWDVPRTCPVSGNCGAALNASGVFIDEAFPGGQVLSKRDLASGAVLYQSPLMAGFTDQNAPLLWNDLVFFSRTQNNTAVDFLFAFQDTGTALVQLWSTPVRWTTSHEHGVGLDGSIYTFNPLGEFVRLDPFSGLELGNAGVYAPAAGNNLSAKTAVDAQGRVYLSNGWASSPANQGRLWAFTPDLTQVLFTLTFARPNNGGPALGGDGSLVMCDLAGVYAYREPISSYCTAGTSANGCAATLSATGAPDANAGSGFTITASGVDGQRAGLVFYGISGRVALAWGASSSFFCVKSPVQRTPPQNSGGTAASCDGSLSLDWNQFISSVPSPLGAPFSGGELVQAQAWYRDPVSAKSTALSNALEFIVSP